MTEHEVQEVFQDEIDLVYEAIKLSVHTQKPVGLLWTPMRVWVMLCIAQFSQEFTVETNVYGLTAETAFDILAKSPKGGTLWQVDLRTTTASVDMSNFKKSDPAYDLACLSEESHADDPTLN